MTPCEAALLKTLEKQGGKFETIKGLADASYVSYRHACRCLTGDCLKAVLIKIRPGRSARIIIKRKDKKDGCNF